MSKNLTKFALLVGMTLLMPSYVSADWVGTILLERPAGQAAQEGWTEDANSQDLLITTPVGAGNAREVLFLTCIGFIEVELTRSDGSTVFRSVTVSGSSSLSICIFEVATNHVVLVRDRNLTPATSQPLFEEDLPNGTKITVSVTGKCDHVRTFNDPFTVKLSEGPQLGRLTFEYEVNPI